MTASASLTHLTARIGLATTVAVGIPMLVMQLAGDATTLVARPWAWWAAYLVFLAAFAMSVEGWPRPLTVHEDRIVLAVMAVTGLAAFVVAPDYGFTIVLPIVTACAAGFIVGLRGAIVVAVVQVLVVAVTLAVATDATVGEALVAAAAWSGFMGFAIVTVEAGAREARARDHLAEVNRELATTNEQLAAANAELEAAQELLAASSRNAERLRISRELHDVVGHQLTALALQLEAASHQATGPAADAVARSREIARALLADVRDVVGQLREEQVAADLGGVPDAAAEPGTRGADVAHRVTTRADRVRSIDVRTELHRAIAVAAPLRIHLELDDEALPLDHERATALVRTVQEVVTNTVRHASADNLWIDVARVDGDVVMSARDDGRGVDVVVAGHGLVGMRERLAAIGGTVRTWSPPGDGFHLEVTMPVRAHVR